MNYDDIISKRIKKDCVCAIIKMLLAVVMFATASIILKNIHANDSVGMLVMSILLILSLLFPAFTAYKFFCLSLETIFELFKKVVLKRDWHAFVKVWKNMLESKFGWKIEETFAERHFKSFPILGKRLAASYEQRVEKSARGIFFHSGVYLASMIIFWLIYKNVMLPALLKYSIGRGKFEIFWDYLMFAWNQIRNFI